MPVCEGRPGVPCPDLRNDRSVHLSQGDLMLCDACEKFRFPCTDGKDCRQGTHTSTHRKTVDNRSLRHGTDSRATQPVVADADQTAISTQSGISRGPSADSCTVSPGTIIINELLTYVSFFRNKATFEGIRRTVLGFFSANDIGYAKKVMIGKYINYLDSSTWIGERRNSSTRMAHEAEIDDICGIFDALDSLNVLNNCTFVAANLDNLPKYGPEELNVAAVVDRQVRVEATIKDMSVAVNQLLSVNRDSSPIDIPETTKQVASIQASIELANNKIDSLYGRFDRLNDVCARAFQFIESQRTSPVPPAESVTIDRSLNIVLFGVKEDRIADNWHQSVADIMRYVLDRDVAIDDMYRLGRFNSDKTRPVLIKLRTVWDKRLILSKCNKLKTYNQRGVFIAPDEPLDVRRRNALDQLKYRAQRAGKNVEVVNDTLVVDGTAVYSLSTGRISTDGN